MTPRAQYDIIARDRTKAAFKSIQRGLGNVTSRIFNLKTAIGGVVGAAGIGRLISSSLSAVDAQAKLADRIGVNIESLTALQQLTELSGSSTEQFNSVIEAMSKRLGEAAQGTGEAQNALDVLNLNIEDLINLPVDRQLELIANRMQTLATESERNAVLSDLFSRQGVQLNNTMKALADEGLEGVIERMRRYGVAISRVDARRIEATNDAITETQAAIRGLGNTLTLEFSKPIQDSAEALTKLLVNNRNQAKEFAETTINTFGIVLEGAGKIIAAIEENPTIAKYGLIGFLLRGRRGILEGIGIGFLSEINEEAEKFIEEARTGKAAVDEEKESISKFTQTLITLSQSMKDYRIESEKTKGIVIDITQSHLTMSEELSRMSIDLPQVDLAEAKNTLESIENQTGLMRNLEDAGRSTADTLSRGFEDIAFSADSANESILRLINNLSQSIFREVVTKPLSQGLSTSISAGFQSLFSSGGAGGNVPPAPSLNIYSWQGRRHGGPVTANMLYETHGLNRREFFMPRQNGDIVTREQLGTTIQIGSINPPAGSDPNEYAKSLASELQKQIHSIDKSIEGRAIAANNDANRRTLRRL